MSINEELSFTEYTLTEDTTDFIISFDRIGGSTDEVSILVNNTPIENLVGYTVTQVNFNTWRVEPALTTGTVVRLVRTTNLDTMVYVFTAGSKFIAKNIDNNFKQIQHSQQEARDSQAKLQADVNALFLDIQDVRDQVEQAVETANSASALAIATADDIADTNLIVQSEGSQMVTLSDSTVVPNMNKRIEDASGGLIQHNVLQDRDVAEAHPASAISDASGVTQQEINDLTGAPYRVKVGGYNIGERVVLANGDIVKSTVDGNANDPNVNMTGWVNPEEKLKPKKILLQDYVMPEHNGDASIALSLSIADAKLKSSCTIDFEFYEYDFKTLVNESNLNNIKLDASDAVIRNSTGLAEVIRLSNCSNTRWVLDVVEGIETLARHTTIGANFYYFLRFVNSKNCRVHGASSKSIRSLIEFYNCTACKAYDNYHVGFLPEIAETQIANTNYLPYITFSGGRHNLAWGNHAENHGSDVLWGRDAFATIAFGNSGKHLHDNGIYGSSGNNSISFGNSFDYVRGTGIKPRGSRNLAIGNTLSNTYTGVSSTGNGITADTLGANGFGNITAFNAIDKSVNYGVSVGDQDGLYSRGVIVAFNTASGHLGTGVYSPYRISTTHTAVTVGNIVDEHNADLGFLVTGLADRSLNNSGVFALNSGHTTKPLARSTYGRNSVYLGNVNSNGQGIQFRYQLNSVVAGNNALTQSATQSDTYLSENMLYVANGGVATNLSNATTIVEGNANTIQTISSATLSPPPKRANIIARDEVGSPYVSVLIGSSYSWKKITTT